MTELKIALENLKLEKITLRPRKRKSDQNQEVDETKSVKRLRSKLLNREKKNILFKKPANSQAVLPSITKYNINSFFHRLKRKDKETKSQIELKKCLDKMNSSINPLWTSPLYLIHAIKDCVLNRKWNNLTHLLLILVTLPVKQYKPLITHLFQILDRHHPVVQNSYIQGQFNMLVKKSKDDSAKYLKKDQRQASGGFNEKGDVQKIVV